MEPGLFVRYRGRQQIDSRSKKPTCKSRRNKSPIPNAAVAAVSSGNKAYLEASLSPT